MYNDFIVFYFNCLREESSIHGKDWEIRKHDHKSNQKFWHKKIERNIERDKEVNQELTKQGWIVLRFWGKEIQNDLVSRTQIIEQKINERKCSLEKKYHLKQLEINNLESEL